MSKKHTYYYVYDKNLMNFVEKIINSFAEKKHYIKCAKDNDNIMFKYILENKELIDYINNYKKLLKDMEELRNENERLLDFKYNSFIFKLRSKFEEYTDRIFNLEQSISLDKNILSKHKDIVNYQSKLLNYDKYKYISDTFELVICGEDGIESIDFTRKYLFSDCDYIKKSKNGEYYKFLSNYIVQSYGSDYKTHLSVKKTKIFIEQTPTKIKIFLTQTFIPVSDNYKADQCVY